MYLLLAKKKDGLNGTVKLQQLASKHQQTAIQ